MSPTETRWIVQGQAVSNGALGQIAAHDRELRNLQQVAPDAVVLSMTEPRAEKLRSELGTTAIIERDAELPDPRL